jgi:phosphatidylglycerophosphate synthase
MMYLGMMALFIGAYRLGDTHNWWWLVLVLVGDLLIDYYGSKKP